MQLTFDYLVKQQETKERQRKVAQAIASLLLYSLQLENEATTFKGPDSAQRRLTQFGIAQEIRRKLFT